MPYILIDSDTPEPEYELNKMTVEKQLFHIAVQYIHIYTTIPEGQGRNDKMNYRFHPLEGKFILSALCSVCEYYANMEKRSVHNVNTK